mmetsp:Transcript_6594/g.16884  ORF Transcript_6594/g.16884 Transcript_6594/m.16884 type:complete len:206 (+) Transcript_6594:689-1306(+)
MLLRLVLRGEHLWAVRTLDRRVRVLHLANTLNRLSLPVSRHVEDEVHLALEALAADVAHKALVVLREHGHAITRATRACHRRIRVRCRGARRCRIARFATRHARITPRGSRRGRCSQVRGRRRDRRHVCVGRLGPGRCRSSLKRQLGAGDGNGRRRRTQLRRGCRRAARERVHRHGVHLLEEHRVWRHHVQRCARHETSIQRHRH